MAHHAAWEEGAEHQGEEAATTIFQKIVRSEFEFAAKSCKFNAYRKFPEKLRRRSSAYFEPERRESVKSIRWIKRTLKEGLYR